MIRSITQAFYEMQEENIVESYYFGSILPTPGVIRQNVHNNIIKIQNVIKHNNKMAK